MDMVLRVSIVVVLCPCMELHRRACHFDPGEHPAAGRYISALCCADCGAHLDCWRYWLTRCCENPTTANFAPSLRQDRVNFCCTLSIKQKSPRRFVVFAVFVFRPGLFWSRSSYLLFEHSSVLLKPDS